MALIQVTAVIWQSKRPEKRIGKSYNNLYLLNTNRMVDIITYDTDGSQFKYVQAPQDRRCSPDTIETNTSVADLRTAHDITPDSKFATLPIYPTLDISTIATATPVDTLIEWENIALAWQTDRDEADDVSHLTYYTESWKRKTVIVNMTLAEILSEQVA